MHRMPVCSYHQNQFFIRNINSTYLFIQAKILAPDELHMRAVWHILVQSRKLNHRQEFLLAENAVYNSEWSALDCRAFDRYIYRMFVHSRVRQKHRKSKVSSVVLVGC